MMRILSGAALLSAVAIVSAHSQSLRPAEDGTSLVPLAITDPQIIIYRAIGVFDDGQPGNQGASTVFICTNISTVMERVRIRVFANDGSLAQDGTYDMAPKATFTMSTHAVVSLWDDAALNTGLISQGHAAIFATTTNFGCTSMIVNAGNAYPYGTPLTMVRYNPHPGTSE